MSWWVSIEKQTEACSKCGRSGHTEEIDFEVNITFNVARMLMRAGIHPKVLNDMTVEKALPIVKNGYALLNDLPEYFTQFDAVNGWGNVETTLEAIRDFLNVLEHGSHPLDKVRWV